MMDGEKRREALAAYSHHAWAQWMQYQFSKCATNPDGSVVIPAAFVARWMRQMNTSYAMLPDHERGSDREEADKILKIISEVT
jgi:hypothetical protein